jgi:molybdopterin synthase catalytic subunit
MIRITLDDFSVDDVLSRLRTDDMGALVSFVGIVRNESEGREVDSIDIECYQDMTLGQLEAIREEALERFNVEEVTVIHRVGSLKVSDNIMLIAVGAAHRVEAFDACRYVLEQIKRRVPIWKKEVTPKGDFWVDGEEP